MKLVLSILFVVLTVCSWAVQGSAGPYRIVLRSSPDVITVGRAKLLISLTDSVGNPAENATVKVLAQMPGMPMGEREETSTPEGKPGTYTVPAVFGMAGTYDVKISLSGPIGTGLANLSLSTGESSASSGGSLLSVRNVAIVLFLVGGIILVLRQVKNSGQSLNWKSIFNRQALWSFVLLGSALALSVWAINSFRRPGSMTPLEAQVMEMNVPAPEGTLPVALAKVEFKPFSTSVTYNGQAVGFVEQDVISRVSGAIIWMPYYVGTKVTKGQILARLDTTQIDPMVGEKTAGVNTAIQGVGVATMEYQQASNMVIQARAEVSMAESESAEAKSMLDAVQQGRGSAESQVASALTDVNSMRAELRSAQADFSYQQQELQRMKALFDKGAISKDEFQKAQVDVQKSRSEADKAQQAVNRSQNMVLAARAELRKADAEISAARQKVMQAQAQVRAKQAAIATAQSAASAAKAKIGQSRSGVAEASAGLQGATTQRGYAELRAEVDGMITSRVVSPGVVVSPGQSVFKIAQISPIRLQANVPESDLARIRLGAKVKVSIRGSTDSIGQLQVSTISPSVDPNSRMGVVEVLYPNSDSRFRPGQYLSMDISMGNDSPTMVVPRDSVQTEVNGSYVWTADPATNNRFIASRHEIKVIGQSGDWVAVKSGLQPGQQVVVAPPQGLSAGMMVTSLFSGIAKISDTAKAEQTIEITAAGYNPPSISIPSGKPLKLTFIRRDNKTCGTEVIFPDLGIRKGLPLNQPVVVDIPAQPAGKELNFTCPMNMLNGKAVAH